MAVAMKCGMNALMGDITLTKYAPVNFPSEPLDAVTLLVHAPEIIPSYVTNTRESKLGNARATGELDPNGDLPP